MSLYTHYERQKRWLAKNPNYIQEWKKANPEYHYSYLKEWSKSYFGCMSYMYSRARRRVQSEKGYKGLPIMSRKDFYRWTETSDYPQVYRRWVLSGYDKQLSPSVNRLDTTKGYTPDNIEVIETKLNRLDGCKSMNQRRWCHV